MGSRSLDAHKSVEMGDDGDNLLQTLLLIVIIAAAAAFVLYYTCSLKNPPPFLENVFININKGWTCKGKYSPASPW